MDAGADDEMPGDNVDEVEGETEDAEDDDDEANADVDEDMVPATPTASEDPVA